MEYLSTLIAATVTVGVGLAVSHGGLRGSVRGALCLMLLLAVVTPFVGAVGELTELDLALPDVTTGEDAFGEVTLAAFEEGISDALADRYGSALSGATVRARGFLPSDMRADGITVVLPPGSEWLDYREIRDYIEENFTRGGTCEVLYG